MESSSLLEMTVSPLGLKSKQLILSEFSRKTLATRKLRSTLSVSFIPPPGRAALRRAAALRGAGRGSGRRRERTGKASRGGWDRQRVGKGGGLGRAASSGAAGPAQAAERRLLLIVSAILLLRERLGAARGAPWEGEGARAPGPQGKRGAGRGVRTACWGGGGRGGGDGRCLAAILSAAGRPGLPCPGPGGLSASLPLAGPEVRTGDPGQGRAGQGGRCPAPTACLLGREAEVG